jgi:NADH-quinone oxidoreductase subunit N
MTLDGALSIALPELILSIGILALLVVGAFGGDKATRPVAGLAGLVLVLAGAAAVLGPQGAAFHNGFVEDGAAVYSKVVIYLMSAAALVIGEPWLRRLKGARFEYPILILLAALGMGMMVSAGDLISLYIGVELQSLALYVLAAFRRDDAKASEAGLKYFILGALSSGILLYGASLIYGFAGSTRFPDIAAAVHAGAGAGTIFGLVFLICGLAFKVSAAPFHMWTPDVSEGAPTPVVGFLNAAPKLAAMVLFARALADGFPGAVEQWRQVVIVIAIISMLWGGFAGLAQKNLKRLWAYSSIANVGYALVGLASGTQEGMQALLVFMTLYVIDVTGFFACLVALSRDGRPMETFDDMSGLFRERPGIAAAMTVFSLSTLGMPPFAGFWSKFYVFKAAAGAGLGWLAALGLLSSVVAAFYYLRLIKTMWFDPSRGATDHAPADAKGVAFAAALFSFPVVMPFLALLDPWSKAAAHAFGLN